jgi:PPOX class probable F420-dependent enzyme
MLWDPNTPFGARVAQRLQHETIIWLVTTSDDGTPQPSPVWFLHDHGELLIYSRPHTPKLHNITRQPTVALHFNTDDHGDNVVVFHGTAARVADAPASTAVPAYQAKYAAGIAGIGMTPESFAATYSAAIRVTLERVRGW